MADRPPAIVFKYESFNIQSLLNLKAQSLYFGSPRGFNDPYDCAITATVSEPSDDQIGAVKNHYINESSLPSALKLQFQSMTSAELKKTIIKVANKCIYDERENFLNNRGVTCFSECNDDLLMWAHYGGQYKGFCIAFDTSTPTFSKLRRVKYVENVPQIDIVDFTLNKKHNKLLDDLFCTKSISWKYEKEWRAIHSEAGTLFGYEAEALKAIYFGPDIDRQALEIICLIIKGQNPDVQFFEGRRSEKKFKVEFRNCTYTSYIDAKRKGLV
jgi:hypothetical protein